MYFVNVDVKKKKKKYSKCRCKKKEKKYSKSECVFGFFIYLWMFFVIYDKTAKTKEEFNNLICSW